MEDELVDSDIQLGIIAVPAEYAQPVAEKLIAAGVGGILNFAPCRIEVPSTVVLSNVDFTLTLEQLAFQVNLCRTNSTEKDDS
jgi:redox-sensing transcriptional repressor